MMVILNVVKNTLKILGLISFQNPELNVLKPAKSVDLFYNCLVFASNLGFFTSSLWFLFFKAETINDYAESGIFFSVSILTVTLYVVLFYRRSDLVAIILHLEQMVEKSMNLKDFQ